MIKFIYCVRDKKLGSWEAPVFKTDDVEHTTEYHVRGLKLAKPDEIVRLRDFSLYYLGEFDDVEGKFTLLDKEQKLIDYEDYLPRKDTL